MASSGQKSSSQTQRGNQGLSCAPVMPSIPDSTDRIVIVGLTEALLFPRQLPLLSVVVVLVSR